VYAEALIKKIYEEPEKFLAGHYSAKAEKIFVYGWIRTARLKDA
jgi:hypothetical protein